MARDGAGEGVWLRAERQTAGRGRQDRRWASPAGNLYASTIVRLRPADPPAPTLALVAAIALHDVVAIGSLKWPNDLLIEGAKVSGILLERTADAVVIGFGVNLAHAPDLDRPTTALCRYGIATNSALMLEKLAAALAERIGQWRDNFANIRTAWLAAAHPPGTALAVALPDGERLSGSFDGLTADGALALGLPSGERRIIHAGDVFQLTGA